MAWSKIQVNVPSFKMFFFKLYRRTAAVTPFVSQLPRRQVLHFNHLNGVLDEHNLSQCIRVIPGIAAGVM